MNPCPWCGLDLSTLAPGDAAVALRSFPRRYGAVLAALEEAVEGEPTPEGRRELEDQRRRVLAHVAAVVRSLEVSGDQLRRVLILDDPPVELPALEPRPSDAAGAGDAGLGREQAGERLRAVAERVAGQVEAVDAPSWNRVGHLPGGEAVTALDLARATVHIGVHHLRDAQREVGD